MISEYLSRHELFLKQILSDMVIPSNSIRSAMEYSLFSGGKRIRPLLVYLAGELLEVSLDVLDVIAASLELTHCYSLIHDDLPAMDNDDWRRGKLSCHKAYDEATAILVGDGMQALALELLLTRLNSLLSASQIINLSQLLVQASGISGMVSGQSLDLSELIHTVTESQLSEIHRLKTGRLILACFEMVLMSQNAVDVRARVALETYARHIGLVFQMQDDYLDFYAPIQVLGKKRSSDAANQKTTFATLFAKEELEDKINTHYQLALDSLSLFQSKAQNLIQLTYKLNKRSFL